MEFLNRAKELALLDSLSKGQLGVVWGRRRLGKTRLLLEWLRAKDGIYWVADESAPALQREALAQAVAARYEGFDQVVYPSWSSLFDALTRVARSARTDSTLVVDELPYAVKTSPELPSVLQRWTDEQSRTEGVRLVVAGSAQRMMAGLLLDEGAPLFGRASVSLNVQPLAPRFLAKALGVPHGPTLVEAYALLGGVPRYWELAQPFGRDMARAMSTLALDPAGVLHDEPTRLLRQDVPSAIHLKPHLEAIGHGAHRPSEIASRVGQQSSSIAKPLRTLEDMGLVQREQPFGNDPRSNKRSLYRIRDPFTRLWFRIVARYRSDLVRAPEKWRRQLLDRYLDAHLAGVWEQLCIAAVPWLPASALASGKPPPAWGPAARYWHGNGPEWDVVASTLDGSDYLIGEVKWSRARGPALRAKIQATAHELIAKGLPPPLRKKDARVHRVLFFPDLPPGRMSLPEDVKLVNAAAVTKCLDAIV